MIEVEYMDVLPARTLKTGLQSMYMRVLLTMKTLWKVSGINRDSCPIFAGSVISVKYFTKAP